MPAVFCFAVAAPARRRRRSRDPHIDHLGPDVRRAFGALAVLGVRVAPPLWVRRCWRAAGGDRSRRRLVRPTPHWHLSPFYLDADFLLLRDVNIRPRFGEFFFGCIWRRNLSTLRECCVSGKSEPIKTVFGFAAGGLNAGYMYYTRVLFFF
jgi:hypothetical protein